MFTDTQNAELAKPLNREHVKSRKQGGSDVSYVEGYHVENEANRIFGYDGWDRLTVNAACVSERPRKIGKGQYEKDGWGVTYTARVRIVVHAGDRDIIREGSGAGHGIDADLGQAHESALKEAETDAEKRALKTFGNQFGQALYDKEQRDVRDLPPASVEAMLDGLRTAAGNGEVAMAAFWKEHWPAIPREWREHVLAEKEAIKAGQAAVGALRAG